MVQVDSYRKLSILIPVYNEEYFVGQLVEKVLEAPLPAGVERELVIVDDGSSDETPALLQRLAREHPREIHLHTHPVNRGKGAAIRTAIAGATGDICIIQDADLEYDPADFSAVIQPILDGDADVVYGSRFLPSDRRRVLYFWHALRNRVLTNISNMLTDLNLTDMETGYKATKTSILKSIPIRSDGFDLEPELTAKFAKRGCRIYEVPISYRGRSYDEGKKITWRDGIRALVRIIYYWLIDDLYESAYRHAQYRLSRTHRLNRWLADAIVPYVGRRVLELGAGLGNITLKMLPRHRYLLTDVDPLNLDYLESRFGHYSWVDVARLDLSEPGDMATFRDCFDTVLCLEVLDGVEDDEAALASIGGSLVAGGRAILLVGQGRWLYSPLDRVLGQVRRYSRAEIRAKCERAGLVIEQLRPFNRTGSLIWLCNSLLLRRQNIGKLQLKLFDSSVWLLRRLDRLLPLPGLSLLVVARRPG